MPAMLKCGSNLLKNWQICYTLHIQIYCALSPLNTHTLTKTHFIACYALLQGLATCCSNTHGVYFKSYRTTCLHLRDPDLLTKSFLLNANFIRKTIDLMNFSVSNRLTNINFQTFTTSWKKEDGSTSIHSRTLIHPGCLLVWIYMWTGISIFLLSGRWEAVWPVDSLRPPQTAGSQPTQNDGSLSWCSKGSLFPCSYYFFPHLPSSCSSVWGPGSHPGQGTEPSEN